MKVRRRKQHCIQITLDKLMFREKRTPIEVNAHAKSLVELAPEHDDQLRSILADAEHAFCEIAEKPVWAATFSGGKDSAATTCLAIEYLKRHPEVRPKLVILHADTLMEAPPMEAFARSLMLTMSEECRKHGINCVTRIVEPTVEDDYWVLTLGYGYPPFSSKFRPCTDRMKRKPQIRVMNAVAAEFTPPGGRLGDVVGLILGVRVDESEKRRERLSKVCDLTDGECGQLLEAPDDMPGVTTVAPIINAKTCKVWDLDALILPALGWPTEQLTEIYGDEVVRFGCWMCPVVHRVRDIENLMVLEEHAWMQRLLFFREEYLHEADQDENRLHVPIAEGVTVRQIRNPELGIRRGLTLPFRERWFEKLLALQKALGRQLIRPEAVEYIQSLWHIEKQTGKRGKSGRAAGR